MSYFNNNEVITSLPNAITTLLTKPAFVYQNNLTIYNLHCTNADPLNLPFPITVEYIYTGSLVGGVVKGSCKGFCTAREKTASVRIDCRLCFTWFIYGSVPNTLVQQALQNPNQTESVEILDAYIHTMTFKDAVNFIYNNPQIWNVGLIDCQLKEIGFADFLRFKLGQPYDPQKVAQFLSIMNYLCPNFVTSNGLQLSPYAEPDKTFIFYFLQVSNIPFLTQLIDQIEQQIHSIETQLQDEVTSFLSSETSEFETFVSEYYTRFMDFISELESLSNTSEVGEVLSELTNDVYNAIAPFITQSIDNFTLLTSLVTKYVKDKIKSVSSEVENIISEIEKSIPSPPSLVLSLSSAEKYVGEVSELISNGLHNVGSIYESFTDKFKTILSKLQQYAEAFSKIKVPIPPDVLSDITYVQNEIKKLSSEFESEWDNLGYTISSYASEFEDDVSKALSSLTSCSHSLLPTSCYSSELNTFYSEITGDIQDFLNDLGQILTALIPILTIRICILGLCITL